MPSIHDQNGNIYTVSKSFLERHNLVNGQSVYEQRIINDAVRVSVDAVLENIPAIDNGRIIRTYNERDILPIAQHLMSTAHMLKAN